MAATGRSSPVQGTPLWKKLGLSAGEPSRLVLWDAPADFEIRDLPGVVAVTHETKASRRRGSIETMVAFFRDRASVERALPRLSERIFPSGALWIAWPRKAGGHTSDITDNVVRHAALELGIVDVKVAALSDDWSGLRFVWRLEKRTAD